MQRYKLKIEYDGTPFVGWQIQKNGVSIKGKFNVFSTPNRLVLHIDKISKDIIKKAEEIRGQNLNAPETTLEELLRSNNINNPYVSKDLSILKNSVPKFIKSNFDLMKKIQNIKEAKVEDGGSGAFDIFLKKFKE